ncbi:cyclopropane-fatty-acyl-phospholipid synthase [Candidatus Uhrbacteria bacterium CG_4_9_14_3_um_filter_36_7]|uniref:Cyclopropane-fatty-acyl-phospholipid synthase n=1 Tax=Candidatus Uhrbacteria bacterium CG_4_9_14_3_um_filter_36_7 TaxID=1975033 RepID=A0A2M7XIJ1_9BACT|nr:MAG: cyclopropane-fatty-acyl-phospholipid synthase [Candidatus Uhrbacteria bacterium CG_4_9_14_3_um_filter_36_7]
MIKERRFIEQLLSMAGLTLNGPNSFDPQIYDERFYRRVLKNGSLGLGESYMDKWWGVKKLDECIYKILKAELEKKFYGNLKIMLLFTLNYIRNPGRTSKAFEVGEKHYDIGNDLYEKMLDKRLTYTCGYWKEARNLDEAQEAKLDLVCKKIGLKPGMRVLDIGSGWGSFIGYAAQNYGIKAIGLTVSKEQKAYADERYKNLSVETRLQDYRELGHEQFDRIVSLGMFEHVGEKNYRTFMQVVHQLLEDDGLFLLHTIGGNRSVKGTDPWIHRYIFPNGMIPSIAQIGRSIENLFVMEDWHNFALDYDKTLMAWYMNFINNYNQLKSKYNDRFFRMWEYYLLSCAATFRARKNQLWQIILSKKGLSSGYVSIR